MTRTPAVRGIVETCINVCDMGRARGFYESLFGFEVMEHAERFCAFRVGSDALLLFTEGASSSPIAVSCGVIPPHNTVGAGHLRSPFLEMNWRPGACCCKSEESKSNPRFAGSGAEAAFTSGIRMEISWNSSLLERGSTIRTC